MVALPTITPSMVAGLMLAASTVAGIWLALRGFSTRAVHVGSAVQAALLPRCMDDRRTLELRVHRRLRATDPDPRAEDLRHPVNADVDAGNPDPSGLVQVARFLGLALMHAEAPHPAFAAEFEGIRRGCPGQGYRIGYLPDATERAFEAHAWLETAILDLHRQCREAGCWIAPAHLDPFLADHPALAAALRASRGGTVPICGRAIVAHHKAETAARRPLRVPHVGTPVREAAEP